MRALVCVVLLLVDNGGSTARDRVINTTPPTHTPPPSPPFRDQELTVFDLDPMETARQLTVAEYKLFRRIRPYECLRQEWNKNTYAGKVSNAPHVVAMIQRFNKVGTPFLSFLSFFFFFFFFFFWFSCFSVLFGRFLPCSSSSKLIPTSPTLIPFLSRRFFLARSRCGW